MQVMPIHHIGSHCGMLSNLLCQMKVLFQMKIIIKAQKEEKIKVKGLENEIHVDVNELIKNDKKKND